MRIHGGISILLLSFVASTGCNKPSQGTSSGESAAVTPLTASTAGDLTGSYEIKSSANPGGGGAYKGKALIAKIAGYHTIDWTIANSPPYAGVAIATGDKLGVGWGMGGNYGVAVYKIDGGKLSGQWTSKGLSGVGDEELEGSPSIDGAYKITKSHTPDGKSYTGSVTIKPTGSTFSIVWSTSAGSYTGVGIKDGDLLVAGWGTGGKGAGAVLYTVKAGTLDGIWATPGGTRLGSEVLGK